MKPDRDAIGAALSRRIDLEAFYLCGPFGKSGAPSSPDVHVLAISGSSIVRDLHLLPGVSQFERRVEVSVVPLDVVRSAVEQGVASWFMFYTVDKLRGAKPVRESEEAERLRKIAVRRVKIRRSFYAEAIRGLLSQEAQAPGANSETGAALSLLRLTGRLLSLLGLRTIVDGKRTFSRHSDLLADRSLVPGALFDGGEPEAARVIEATKRVIGDVFRASGIDWARLGSGQACAGGAA